MALRVGSAIHKAQDEQVRYIAEQINVVLGGERSGANPEEACWEGNQLLLP